MKTFTKILLSSLTLCLGACDAGDGVDFSDGEVAFRPLTSGIKFNTSFILTMEVPEFHMKGVQHKGAQLDAVCLDPKVTDTKYPVCLFADKGEVWVEKGMVRGQKGQSHYEAEKFINSRWLTKLDYDKNGLLDSSIELRITDYKPYVSPSGYDVFDYYWVYDPATAGGLISKYVEKQAGLVPMCEPDGGDPTQVGSILLEHTSLNTDMATTDGTVHFMPDVTHLACHSSAVAKPTSWGYPMTMVQDQMGGPEKARRGYESIIRAVRLDACNNGYSFTQPGEQVAVDDIFGVNKEGDPSLKLEGIVSLKKGWMCIGDDLRNGKTFADIEAKCPGKVVHCDDLGASHWSDISADLMTQLP
jgi:hypothetical protein